MSRRTLLSGQFGNRLNKYIRHYEGLSYDTETLHNSHQRAKRALSPQDRTVQLDFQAHGRSVSVQTLTLSSSLIHSFSLSSNLTSYYAAFLWIFVLTPCTLVVNTQCCKKFIEYYYYYILSIVFFPIPFNVMSSLNYFWTWPVLYWVYCVYLPCHHHEIGYLHLQYLLASSAFECEMDGSFSFPRSFSCGISGL